MAGDPFLSDPSRKRKRPTKVSSNARGAGSKRSSLRQSAPTPPEDDDEDLELLSEDESAAQAQELDSGNEDDLSSDEEFADENAADKRRRLAKQYLENLKASDRGHAFDDDDFDAQDLDDENIARRLQVDVAEDKGFIYKFIGDGIAAQMQASSTTVATTRIGSKDLTCVSVHYPFAYTTSKDCEIIKWDISLHNRKPQRIKHSKGGFRYARQTIPTHHSAPINCVAASPDGKVIVTGGDDKRIIIWSTENLACLKVLDTRLAVNAVSFRRGTDQLYAACADLRIRTFSINQYAQLEVLYGHQDNITDICALARETCVSVGSRDKTAMFWKIAEESRLTFRGGDSTEKRRSRRDDDSTSTDIFINEGSIEVVSMNDESHFVTGSDNGNLALWSLAKKKALFTERLAHGLQPEYSSAQASAEANLELAQRQIPSRAAYWITAVHAVPFSDIFFSGSFDGNIKVWRLDREGLRLFRLLGQVSNVNGCVVKIDSAEVPDQNKLLVLVTVLKEHKFGRWLGKLPGARNALVTFTFDI